MTKDRHYLIQDPAEPFRMRFGKKYAKELVEAIIKKADEENRSFPNAIECALIDYFKLNNRVG